MSRTEIIESDSHFFIERIMFFFFLTLHACQNDAICPVGRDYVGKSGCGEIVAHRWNSLESDILGRVDWHSVLTALFGKCVDYISRTVLGIVDI